MLVTNMLLLKKIFSAPRASMRRRREVANGDTSWSTLNQTIGGMSSKPRSPCRRHPFSVARNCSGRRTIDTEAEVR